MARFKVEYHARQKSDYARDKMTWATMAPSKFSFSSIGYPPQSSATDFSIEDFIVEINTLGLTQLIRN
jgi:hypothetical protein